MWRKPRFCSDNFWSICGAGNVRAASLDVGRVWVLEKLTLTPSVLLRMESTEKCEAIITHFNGKYIKTPPGVPGEASGNQAERPQAMTSVRILEAFCMSEWAK